MPALPSTQTFLTRLHTLDTPGALLSITWPALLLYALQEGGLHHPWNTAHIYLTLTFGLLFLILFVAYSAWTTHRSTSSKTKTQPLFPFTLISNPGMGLLLLSMFLLGVPFVTTILLLPQRFQIVNAHTPTNAGIHLLPITLLTPVGALLAGLVVGKRFRRFPAEALLLVSVGVAAVAVGLLSSLPFNGGKFWPGTYAYMILVGLGLGMASGPYYFLLYTTVPEKDVAVATGALNMVRTLGGCVAIAICSSIHNSYLGSHLGPFLSPEERIRLLQGKSESGRLGALVRPEVRTDVAGVFARSYNRQFYVVTGLCFANVGVVALYMWVRVRKGEFGMAAVKKEENEFFRGDAVEEEEKTREVQEVFQDKEADACPAGRS
jgi:hypothetical protein